MYHVLTEGQAIERARYLVDDNLWVSPAHIDLAAAEMELAGEVGRENNPARTNESGHR